MPSYGKQWPSFPGGASTSRGSRASALHCERTNSSGRAGLFLRSVISLFVGYYVLRTEVLPMQTWDDEAEIARIVDLMLDGLRPR